MKRAFLTLVLIFLYGCLPVQHSGLIRPTFEPHVPSKTGTALVYVYQYVDGPSEGTLDLPGNTGIILPRSDKTDILVFVNGREAGPFNFGHYTVHEVGVGFVDVELRYPQELQSRFRYLSDQLPEAGFRVNANESYYVWGRITHVRGGSNPSGRNRLVLTTVQEEMALRHLRGLRKDETYP